MTGLAGDWTPKSKLKCIIVGLQGIIVINLVRIVTITLVLNKWGSVSAILFHDNFSHLLTIIWISAFWFISNEFMLKPNLERKTWGDLLKDAFRIPLDLLGRGSRGKRNLGLATILIVVSSIALGGFMFYAGYAADVENWWDDDWQYRTLIIQNHNAISSNLNEFPMLVKGNYTDLIGKTQTNAEDIVFVDYDNSTRIQHEIECYDPATGNIAAWVNVDLSSSLDKKFWMYYGNPSCAPQENPEGVWDTNFMMVHHLAETSGDHSDSTSNHNNEIECNGIDKCSQGIIDGADYFDGIDDLINIGQPSTLNFVPNSHEFTFEAWIKLGTDDDGTIFAKGGASSSGRQFQIHTSPTFGLAGWIGGTVINNNVDVGNGRWTYIVGINYIDSGLKFKFYVNGTADDTIITSGSATNSLDVLLGARRGNTNNDWGYNFPGLLDEIRVSNTARDTNWIDACFETVSNPSNFYQIGEEIEISEDLLYLLLPALLIPKMMSVLIKRRE